MNNQVIKWIIFITLFLTFPAMLFLVQVVMFMPAVFLLAGIVYMFFKTFNPANLGEHLSFITIFAIHILLYSGIYYFISYLLTKLISLAKSDNVRIFIVLTLCLALVGITFFPLYGGGGHDPVKLVALHIYLGEINEAYGPAASAVVYGSVILMLFLKLLINRHRSKKSGIQG